MTSYTRIEYPLDTKGISTNRYLIAVNPARSTGEVFVTCTDTDQRVNQTFRLAYNGGRISTGASPIETRTDVLISDMLVNPASGSHEIWRLTRDNISNSATATLEILDIARQTSTIVNLTGEVSAYTSLEFTQDMSFVMATFDGINLHSVDVQSRKPVVNTFDIVQGEQPALIWRASAYRGSMAGPLVRQMNKQGEKATYQIIDDPSSSEGHYQELLEYFDQQLPPHPTMDWVGQNPGRPEVWGLLAPQGGLGAIQLAVFTTEGAKGLRLVEAPFDGYEGALTPCANPATGLLQFIDPRNGRVMALDPETAAVSTLTSCPLDAYSAVMRCDASGVTWIAGNHPQRGAMLWGYAPV